MASKRSGDVKSSIISIIWFFIFAGFLYALVTSGNVKVTPENFIYVLRNKSLAVQRFYNECAEKNFKNCKSLNLYIDDVNREKPFPGSDVLKDQGIGGGGINHGANSGTNGDNPENNTNEAPVLTEKDILVQKLNEINLVEKYDRTVKYKRTEWKHWINVEGSSCWTTREEALYRQAVPNSIVMLDSKGKKTTDKSKACSIESGKWNDPYTNQVITDPTKTDVDHTSALAATARAGGNAWDREKKKEFANDLDHLVVTSQKANRQKGDKTPSEWMPENKSSWCQYSKIYINILKKYNLNITQEDKDVLNNVLSTCQF